MVQAFGANAGSYERRRPERTALYQVVRDNIETLYGAIDDGALDIKLGKHAKKELEAYPRGPDHRVSSSPLLFEVRESRLRALVPRFCAGQVCQVQ